MAEQLHEWINYNAFESKVWTDFQKHFNMYVKSHFENPEPILELVDFEKWINGIDVAPK